MDSSKKILYVVDHQEEFLLDWCRWEYSQMMYYLSKSNSTLWITNSNTFENYNKEEAKELNDKCVVDLKKENESVWNNKLTLVSAPIKDLISEDRYMLTLGNDQFDLSRVCLLDMKAEKILSPEDANEFDVFLLGGILGDIPSKDKTSILRQEGFKSRHLGSWQMTTDTALLCVKLVVENKVKIEDIPYVDEPEFEKRKGKKIEETVSMEGFRYILDSIDPHTGEITKKSSPKPQGNANIYENIIFEELNQDFF